MKVSWSDEVDVQESNPADVSCQKTAGYKAAPVSGVQTKVAVQRTATLHPSEIKALDRLTHYVAPRYTKRTERPPSNITVVPPSGTPIGLSRVQEVILYGPLAFATRSPVRGSQCEIGSN